MLATLRAAGPPSRGLRSAWRVYGKWRLIWLVGETTALTAADAPSLNGPPTSSTPPTCSISCSTPSADHLVDRVTDWPGAHSYLAMLSGEDIEVERPRDFFTLDGTTPEVARIELVRPPGFEHCGQSQWREDLSSLVTAIEDRTRAERLRTGARLLGRQAVLRASAFDTPQTSEPRRNLRPSVACKDEATRVHVLTRLMAFRRAHETARLRVAAGELEAMFPY